MAKHRGIALVILAALLALSACSAPAAGETDYTPIQIAAVIADSQSDLPELTASVAGDDFFSAYVQDYYELEPEAVIDGVVCYAGGVQACELAVLTAADPSGADAVRQALLGYVERRAAAFAGYVPEQAAMVESAEVVVSGSTAALLICPDPSAGSEAFLSCFGSDAPPFSAQTQFVSAQTGEVVMADAPAAESDADPYDRDAVLQAWQTGDPSGLSDKNRAVHDRCQQVIDEVITGDMTDFEKELAVHDWIIDWAEYDSDTLSHASDFEPDPDNDNPYGLLVNQKAVCMGYTSTFQLLMDMLGIECITVEGTAYGETEAHAWNQVQLDGEWYAVDVTWDDPVSFGRVSERTAHTYFNVTSEFLRWTDHQWDEDSVPEAEGTTYVWQP